MTRFQLIVQQLGKEPAVVPLTQAIVVGRSRRADLTIDDEEVGREQFRLGIENGRPFLEGIGTTNQTICDGAVIPSGHKRVLASGASIRVGRTTFTIRDTQATEESKPGGEFLDVTLVAPRPAGSPPSGSVGDATQTPVQERTDAASPMRTMPGVRPGARGPDPDATMPPSPPGKKGAPPPPPPEAEPEQTMQMRGGPGYRPGQAPPPERTIAAQRPGPTRPDPQRPDPQRPDPQRPEALRTEPAPVRPATPPAPAAKVPATPPPASGEKPLRPTTIAVNPVDIAAEISKVDIGGPQPIDVEARLHEMLPRLFVKCDGMKRRVRLMKARNMLGRAEAVDVLLPNESVSEQHAEILFDGTKWMLRDRGSTNGSFVDGGQLRGGSQELQRHSIIGLGIVRAIFLCNDRRDVAGQRRLEERAVKLLVQAGRLQADAGREALRVARADASQSIAELLLMDTPLSPAEWATAITTARGQRGFLDTVKQVFERLRKNRRGKKQ